MMSWRVLIRIVCIHAIAMCGSIQVVRTTPFSVDLLLRSVSRRSSVVEIAGVGIAVVVAVSRTDIPRRKSSRRHVYMRTVMISIESRQAPRRTSAGEVFIMTAPNALIRLPFQLRRGDAQRTRSSSHRNMDLFISNRPLVLIKFRRVVMPVRLRLEADVR